MPSNKARDARGRWQKGHCPNPSGRPRKKAAQRDSDIIHFKNGLIKITLNDKEQVVTRHEALIHMMFARAMKGGSVLITRKLYELFEGADETITNALETLDLMRRDYQQMPNKRTPTAIDLAKQIERLEDLLTVDTPKPERNRRRVRTAAPAGARAPTAAASFSTSWREEVRARRLAREQAQQTASPTAAADQATCSSPAAPSQGASTEVPPPAKTKKD